MSSLYRWCYFLTSLGWTGWALARGWYNCTGKQWVLEHVLPVSAVVFTVGAAVVMAGWWVRKRRPATPRMPVGELLLFSLVVSLASILSLVFILSLLHQDCC